jgi:hypothetical protein
MGFLFHVFKLAQNGVPVFVEDTPDLDAAISRVNALRENSPDEYVVVSQAMGRRTLFMAKGGMKRS